MKSKNRLSRKGRQAISEAARKRWREYRIEKRMRETGCSRQSAAAWVTRNYGKPS